ncbi:ornithine carbamoyltransferase [Sulfuriroseicoccus oceanibius]|uniref:Ornithine carbamoyltransferase n=1 Tax=Sulfuriroseicoccus oceanibius TaxID=2707525 RepID=A0A6B3L7U6_9BACT|nr:ornithine carbamoyltransferase [Sulfuriroseicoccus oceanibius]QQL46249.1 ornithine carbamoyltransferase [Sulfuriroseicoccus oceanibius]
MKHLLGIQHCTASDLERMIELGEAAKRDRGSAHSAHAKLLDNQVWGLIFSKASTRTRVSFEVGVREMGGTSLYLSARDMQLGRGEPIEDTARVLGRMVHGAIIRTFEQSDVETFAKYSGIPTINALTDEEHPCQIIADLLTVRERFGTWEGRKIVYLGDGDNNMSRSWMWAAERLGFELVIAAPEMCMPSKEYQQQFSSGHVTFTGDVESAVADASVLYTDVWVSMGQEDMEDNGREAALQAFQVNHEMVKKAADDAIVLHCLPAYRGKEITAELLEERQQEIFTQAENRLHAQKGVMQYLVRG